MPQDSQKPRLRGQPFIVKLKHLFARRHHPSLRHVSDAKARDIGLSPSEVELLRFEFPSQTIQHRGL
jgi:hypothetical protein